MVAPRIRTGLDGDKTIAADVIGDDAACAEKVRIKRRWMIVALVLIAPGGVGLPDFDQCIWHSPTVFVEDAPSDNDAFALWRLCKMLCEIVVVGPKQSRADNGSRQFAQSVRQVNQRLRWRTLESGSISFASILGLAAGHWFWIGFHWLPSSLPQNRV